MHRPAKKLCYWAMTLCLAALFLWAGSAGNASPFSTATPTPQPTETPSPSAKSTPKPKKATPAPKSKKAKPTPNPITEAGIKKNLKSLVADARKENGVRTLTFDAKFEAAAQTRAKELVEKFSHTRPDGRACTTVYSKVYGENILALASSEQLSTSEILAKMAMYSWMDSPSHEKVMMYPRFKYIGLGYHFENNTHYFVQLFGY